jgi:cytochrome b561
MTTASDAPKHGLVTRLIHAALAISVVLQLLSSLVMTTPRAERAGDRLFFVHEYIGIAAFAAALGFWLLLAFRRQGTPMSKLYPWFTKAGRDAVIGESIRAFNELRARRIPDIGDDDVLPSAIHGLGLALVSAMATFGVLWYGAALAGYGDTLIAWALINLHAMFGNLAWAYLIGHVGMAALHQFLGHPILQQMWSFSTSKTDADIVSCVEAEQPE